MSCDRYEAGSRIEAIGSFKIEETLAAPVPGNSYEIQPGDTGEVTEKHVVRNTHWLRVRWDRLHRTLNLDQRQLDLVKLVD